MLLRRYGPHRQAAGWICARFRQRDKFPTARCRRSTISKIEIATRLSGKPRDFTRCGVFSKFQLMKRRYVRGWSKYQAKALADGRKIKKTPYLKKPGRKLLRELRQKIAKRDGQNCVWCGKKLNIASTATIEHMARMADGGTNHPGNIKLACARCNHTRSVNLKPRRFSREGMRIDGKTAPA